MKYIKIIISLLIIGLILFFVFKSLKNNQEDSAFTLVKLNEINNQGAFLWVDAIIDTSWIKVPISVNDDAKEITPNAKLQLIVYEYSENNKLIVPELSLYVKDIAVNQIKNNTITLSINDIENFKNGILTLGIISNQVGNHRYSIDFKSGEFDKISEKNPDARYELSVSKQLSSLKIIFIVFFIFVITCLLCWFFLLKKEFFPTFSYGGSLRVSVFQGNNASELYFDMNCRKMILGQSEEKQNKLQDLFIGRTQYELPELEYNIEISPVVDVDLYTDEESIKYFLTYSGDCEHLEGDIGYMYNGNFYKFTKNSGAILEFEYFNPDHQKIN